VANDAIADFGLARTANGIDQTVDSGIVVGDDLSRDRKLVIRKRIMKLKSHILRPVGNDFGLRTRKSDAPPTIRHAIAVTDVARIAVAAFGTNKRRSIHT
jgi:hypothetical protein